MPMTWNANADAKLCAAVMTVYDVKVSGVKLQEVAAIMGDDCTAKAITHRLNKIKSNANSISAMPSTPSIRGRKASVPKSSTKSTKSTGKGKGSTQPTWMHDDNTDDSEPDDTPLKRKVNEIKTEQDVENGVGIGEAEVKKIKTEPVELEDDEVWVEIQ